MTYEEMHAEMRPLIETTGFSMKSFDRMLHAPESIRLELAALFGSHTYSEYKRVRRGMLANEERWANYALFKLNKLPEVIEMKAIKNELKEKLKEIRQNYKNSLKASA